MGLEQDAQKVAADAKAAIADTKAQAVKFDGLFTTYRTQVIALAVIAFMLGGSVGFLLGSVK